MIIHRLRRTDIWKIWNVAKTVPEGTQISKISILAIDWKAEEPIYGKYGMLRKQFLKEHRSAKYQYLLLTGKLTEHLNQIDQEARKQVEILMEQMVKKQGATEELKAQDQMKWVRLMINIKSSAEEIVVKNTIYM